MIYVGGTLLLRIAVGCCKNPLGINTCTNALRLGVRVQQTYLQAITNMQNVQSSFYQQMHSLLNIKILKLTIKISLYLLLHVSVHSDHPQGAYAEPC
jgi:hypothetical protein